MKSLMRHITCTEYDNKFQIKMQAENEYTKAKKISCSRPLAGNGKSARLCLGRRGVFQLCGVRNLINMAEPFMPTLPARRMGAREWCKTEFLLQSGYETGVS